jgi:general secretion pathway protein L
MPTSPTEETARTLIVPGSEVAIHWLELAEGLTPAQAAGAARLLLAEASADPLADMHVALGRPERGLTPVGLVANALMAEWLAGDPDLVIPSPFLLLPPAEGLVRREGEVVSDYRGAAAAFSVEPALAALLIGDAPVRDIGDAEFEAGAAAALAAPALNLRQGAFARRRQWAVARGSTRRAAALALALVAVTLLFQLAAILRYTFAADRLEQQAAAVAAAAPAGAADPRLGFAPLAALLFDAIRATPNVELVRIDYRPDGALAAAVTVDSPATFTFLRQRLEATGLSVEGGAPTASGARAGAEIVLRPA